MNTLELMDGSVSSFSKTDHAIYEAIRKFPDNFATMSVTQIAESTGFSKPALTRFAQRLGFGGFVEFQFQFAKDLAQSRARTDVPTRAEAYGKVLLAVEEQLDRGRLGELATRMQQSHCVYLMGYNLSRLPAEELGIALQFESAVHATVPQVDLMPNFRCDDLVLVYSAVSGNSHKGMFDTIAMGRTERPHLVLATTNAKHPLRRRFDEVFVLPSSSLACANRTALGDTLAFLMFNDALVSAFAQHEGDLTLA